MEINMSKILDVRVVLLDAAGTLFRVRGSVGAVYSELAARHGVQAPHDQVEQRFVSAFRRKSAEGIAPQDTIDPEVAEKRWWREIVQEVFSDRMSEATMDSYFHDVFEHFRTAAAWEVYPDTSRSLEDLRSRGLRLAVVSNFDSRLFDILENLEIGRFFENTFISWRAGVAKPDPRIFRDAVGALGVAPARALHVGDSLQEDYQGAIRAGLRAVLLDRRRLQPPSAGVPTIGSLDELKELI